MNLGDLIGVLRSERLDDTVEPYLYPTETLTRHYNDAVRQAAIRKRLILDRTTAACCSASVAANQVAIRLHPRVLAVRSARWSATTTPLRLTTLKVMDRDHPEWTTQDASIPTHLVLDTDSGKVVLWPTPDTAGTLQMAVWRSPLETEEMEALEDDPAIDESFHADLIDWAEHLAYLVKDGEAGDKARSDAAEERFTAKFGRLPSAHEIKCWAIAPARGQRAEFV